MKKVAIVGLGWLGMPLAMSLSARGWQVTGSKTTQDGVEAARMSGIDSYLLRMEPELVCDSDDLDALMDADALVITLPARRSGPGDEFYLQAVQELVDSALAHRIPRIIFTSSTSVYGDAQGTVKETTPRNPVTNSGRVLEETRRLAAQFTRYFGRYSASCGPGRTGTSSWSLLCRKNRA